MPTQDHTPTKVCAQCGADKPLYEFHKHNREKDGYRRVCKLCRAKNEGHTYKPGVPDGFKRCPMCEKVLPATDGYFFRDERRAYGLASTCKSCHVSLTRKWQQEHWEFFSNINAQWRRNNPEKVRQMRRNWLRNNPDMARRVRERSKVRLLQYRIEHPDRVKANAKKSKAKRKARIRNAPGSHTAVDIRALYDLQGGHCGYCGITLYWDITADIHVDHITPLSRGGSNNPENLVLACAECNLTKNNKTPAEWTEARGW